MKDLLDDVPLPEANHLLLSGAVLAGSAGLATVMKPTKMHEAYFTETDKDDLPLVQHKPSTRWLGMSLCWVSGMNFAAALAPKGNKVKRNLLVANGAGLLAGASTKPTTGYEPRATRFLVSPIVSRRVQEPLTRPKRSRKRLKSQHPPYENPDKKHAFPGAAMDAYNLAKNTQKKKITGAEIATIGTLGALSLTRAIKDKDDVADE